MIDRMVKFQIQHVLKNNPQLRTGALQTSHGVIQTPCVVPFTNSGDIAPLSSLDLLKSGCQCLGINILPLSVRPGTEILNTFKSIHEFIGWDKPIISSVGPFLPLQKIKNNIGQLGIRYHEPYTNAQKRMSPETFMRVQKIGKADVQLPLWVETDYYAPVDDLQKVSQIDAQLQDQIASEWGVIGGGGLKAIREQEIKRQNHKKGYLIRNLPQEQSEWDRIVKETISLLPASALRIVFASNVDQIQSAIRLGVDIILTSAPQIDSHEGIAYIEDKLIAIKHRQYADDHHQLEIDDNIVSYAYLHYLYHIRSATLDRLLCLYNWQQINACTLSLRNKINNDKG